MSKYNVGDVVKLRDDLEVGKRYDELKFNANMENLKNKPVKIVGIDLDGDYEIGSWYINDEMIEGLWEECKEKQVTMKYKIGDRFRYKDEYNTYEIIRCDEEVGKYITVEEKQVGSRVFDVCEEKNMFLEECKEKQDKLKLIDVLNMIAKGELKEGTKVIRGEETYIWNNKDCFFYNEKDNFICLDPMKCLSDEVELIEPSCEHEWEVETIRNGIGDLRRFRRCVKCGFREEAELYNHFADAGKMEKIEELEECEFYTEGAIVAKLNEVIRKINKEE